MIEQIEPDIMIVMEKERSLLLKKHYWAVAAVFILTLFSRGAFGEIFRVKSGADSMNVAFGNSWAESTNLQRALALAQAGDEIWVASGLYYPDEGEGQINDSQNSTFQLVAGVNMFGGFAGTELEKSERSTNAEPSVLSGDIDNNDRDLDGNGVAERSSDIVGRNCSNVVTGADLIVERFTITAGYGTTGGGVLNSRATLTLMNCILRGNFASSRGGAVHNEWGADSVFINCWFNGNSSRVGGVISCVRSRPSFINCTFDHNTAGREGAVIYVDFGSMVNFRNCILWNNISRDSRTSIYALIANDLPSAVAFSHSVVENSGGSGNWKIEIGTDDGGNLDVHPLFVEGSPELQAISSVSDAGDSSALPRDDLDLDGDGDLIEPFPIDLRGHLREQGAAVAIGAIEPAGPKVLANIAPIRVEPNATDRLGVIQLASVFDASATAYSVNSFHPTGIVSPTVDSDTGSLSLSFEREVVGAVSVVVSATDESGASSLLSFDVEVLADVLFVDKSATGANSGLSWQDAFTHFQDALAVGGGDYQIWMVSDTHYPDEGANQWDGDTSATFRLNDGVKIYGGFRGHEALLSERDPTNRPTVLSGDISQDDINTDGNEIAESTEDLVGENSESLITAENLSSETLLTGIVITAGKMINVNSSPTLINCFILGCTNSYLDNAISNFDLSRPRLINCLLSGNVSAVNCWDQSSAKFVNCTFTANRSSAIRHALGSEFANCIIWGNSSGSFQRLDSSSIDNFPDSKPVLANSIIAHSGGSGNWNDNLGSDGGGNRDLDPLIVPGIPTLQAHSPAIGSGDPDAMPNDFADLDGDGDLEEPIPFDLLGNQRFSDSKISIGAIEPILGPRIVGPIETQRILPNSAPVSSYVELADVYDQSAVTFELISVLPDDLMAATVDVESGAVDLTFSPERSGVAQLLFAATDASGRKSYITTLVELLPEIIFVDRRATGSGTGLSWADAFVSLQDALSVGGEGYEIWVAAGVYYPDEGANVTQGTSVQFDLPENIEIYGGFRGTESLLEERELFDSSTRSVLSGDIGQDDLERDDNTVQFLADRKVGGNSSTVVVARGVSKNTRLDGFTITGADINGISIVSSSLVIVNCRLTGNFGRAALRCAGDRSIPLIRDCEIIENIMGVSCSIASSPTFVDCLFSTNSSSLSGTAFTSLTGSRPTVLNCRFEANRSERSGAAFYNEASATLVGCVFTNNVTSRPDFPMAEEGGAVFNSSGSEMNIINCTLTGNSALKGGAIYNEADSNVSIVNSIIWNNVSAGRTDLVASSIENAPSATPTISNSIIANSGGSNQWDIAIGADGGGNLDADPVLLPDNLSLQVMSPARDGGLRSALPPDFVDIDGNGDSVEIIPVDLLGNPRTQGMSVDIGATEMSDGPLADTNVESFRFKPNEDAVSNLIRFDTIFDDSAVSFEIAEIVPPGIVAPVIDRTTGSIDLEFNKDTIGDIQIVVSAVNASNASSFITLRVSVVPEKLFVDKRASGSHTGVTWPTAFANLQDALNTDLDIKSIWVASGTYFPDEGVGQIDGDQAATFRLRNGVAIYGGFRGTEESLAERDLSRTSPSILSGDISQDDVNVSPNGIGESVYSIRGNNSFHVVSGSNTSSTAVLDGFLITAGQSPDTFEGKGAGIFIESGDPVIANCRIIGNRANNEGGGLYTSGANPSLVNCIFAGNTAKAGGGCFVTENSNPSFTNCLIRDNDGLLSVVGIQSDSRPDFTNCTISKNRTVRGGIIKSSSSNPTFSNCIIWNNESGNRIDILEASIENSGAIDTKPRFLRCVVANSGGSNAWISETGIDLGGNLDLSPDLMPQTLGIQPFSIVANAGSSEALPNDIADLDGDGDTNEPIPYDAFGNPRVQEGEVAIGISEPGIGPRVIHPIDPLFFSTNSQPVPDAISLEEFFDPSAVKFAISQMKPLGIVEASIDESSGRVSLLFLPDAMGEVEIQISGSNSEQQSSVVAITLNIFPPQIFVDSRAEGESTGLSWEDAIPNLQDAFAIGGSGYEIWVAKGIYYPDEGVFQTDDNEHASFCLPAGVKVFGGFLGEEDQRSQRSLTLSNRSILSGDIGQDDVDGNDDGVIESTDDLKGINSFQVVNFASIGESCSLDGFTVTAGNPDPFSIADPLAGAGVRLRNDGQIANCELIGNKGISTGAMSIERGANTSVVSCDFQNNFGLDSGAIYIEKGVSASLVNCAFTANARGAIVTEEGGSIVIDQAFFVGNIEGEGTIKMNGSSLLIQNSIFSGNSGGSLELSNSPTRIVNCTLTGNSRRGSPLFVFRSDTDLTNSIIWNNRTGRETNTTDASLLQFESKVTFSHCLVANSGGSSNWDSNLGADLGGNIDVDPMFVLSIDPSSAPNVSGDFSLLPNSPAVDAGDGSFFAEGAMDIGGRFRMTDGSGDGISQIDMGAWELPGLSVADTDGDGFSDVFELEITGSPTALQFPQLSSTWRSLDGDYFPTIRYAFDSRLEGAVQFLMESSEDLGEETTWQVDSDLLHLTSFQRNGFTIVELRISIPDPSAIRNYYRLRVKTL